MGLDLEAHDYASGVAHGYHYLRFAPPLRISHRIDTAQTDIYTSQKSGIAGLHRASYEVFKNDREVDPCYEPIRSVLNCD